MSFRDIVRLPILSIFHSPACSKSRATLAILERAIPTAGDPTVPRFRLDVVEYTKQPPTSTQLRLAAQYLGLQGEAVQAMLRPDAPKVRDVDEMIQVVGQDPARLERPIVVDWEGAKAVIGRPPERVEELIRERIEGKDE
ncbi:hypothetical protein BC937DRAFT_89819 [Endogone sp. FLAS-F59071]|nr:hypothetical protein BC937DRAFT_89819 [Endogone sp. FLAS-F59071]|eukprot:RUS17550.1 hypothetical protein BC937DRAFT_89819 [Endogone sp. FLAS-F59071]